MNPAKFTKNKTPLSKPALLYVWFEIYLKSNNQSQIVQFGPTELNPNTQTYYIMDFVSWVQL